MSNEIAANTRPYSAQSVSKARNILVTLKRLVLQQQQILRSHLPGDVNFSAKKSKVPATIFIVNVKIVASPPKTAKNRSKLSL